MATKKRWYIGRHRDWDEPIYMEDFSWECGWYWSGGHLGNRNCHYHFFAITDNENINLYDAFHRGFGSTILREDEVWRLCDLMKQFYAYQEAAECFQYGGHYTSKGRTSGEINPFHAKTLNRHIELFIIPEVRRLMDKAAERGENYPLEVQR